MVIFIVHGIRILAEEPKGDTPVATDLHGRVTLTIPCQRMKTQTWKIHVLGAGRGVQSTQNQAEPVGVLRLDACLASSCEEALQPLMLESDNHDASVTRGVTGYKGQAPAITGTQPRGQ